MDTTAKSNVTRLFVESEFARIAKRAFRNAIIGAVGFTLLIIALVMFSLIVPWMTGPNFACGILGFGLMIAWVVHNLPLRCPSCRARWAAVELAQIRWARVCTRCQARVLQDSERFSEHTGTSNRVHIELVKRANAASNTMTPRGFEALSERERVLLSVWLFVDAIRSKTFRLDLAHGRKDWTDVIAYGVETIGVTELVPLLRSAGDACVNISPELEKAASTYNRKLLNSMRVPEAWVALEAEGRRLVPHLEARLYAYLSA